MNVVMRECQWAFPRLLFLLLWNFSFYDDGKDGVFDDGASLVGYPNSEDVFSGWYGVIPG